MPTRARNNARRGKPVDEPKPPKRPRGRPRTEISWSVVDKLCAIHCTLQEISDVIDVPLATIEHAIQRDFGTTFRAYYLKKTARGKMSLRRAQYESAVGRDAVFDSKGRIITPAVKPTPDMQKWLGIQWLGQTPEGTPDRDDEQENFDDDADSAPMPADAVVR